MNSKTLLILLSFVTLKLQAAQYNYDRCRDVLTEIKTGAPYKDQDSATLAAINIALEAQAIANDPFSDKNKRKDAARRADCASFFTTAGVYYTYQKEFDAFHEQFTAMQKNNAKLTQQEFLTEYLSKPGSTSLTKLSIRAKEREKSDISSPEERSAGSKWKSALQEYAKAVAATQAAAKEAAEKYIQ